VPPTKIARKASVNVCSASLSGPRDEPGAAGWARSSTAGRRGPPGARWSKRTSSRRAAQLPRHPRRDAAGV